MSYPHTHSDFLIISRALTLVDIWIAAKDPEPVLRVDLPEEEARPVELETPATLSLAEGRCPPEHPCTCGF